MAIPVEAAIAANRFGLGAREGELGIAAPDPRGWLRAQLDGSPPRLDAPGLVPSSELLARVVALRAEARRPSGEELAVAARLGEIYRPAYLEEAGARLARAVATERPFIERLVHFWSNHFAVSVDKIAVLGLAGGLEREAIRPHVLGSFADLLLAVERHPAMLLYLDNHLSIGPGSDLARRVAKRRSGREVGLNENLAREILELHTLGVGGGYSQADVTTLAKVITGWSIGGGPGRLADGTPGTYIFRESFHEPGPQTLLGRRYAQTGESQGMAVLRDLAIQPATARHVSTKLARHFVADDPPAAVVERLTRAWLDGGGALLPVYRALVDSPEAWRPTLAKFKTPADLVHSTYRALDLPAARGRLALASFERLGQRTWSPGSPAGWPDRAVDWDGPAALMARIEWAGQIADRLGDRRRALDLAESSLGPALSVPTRGALAQAASGAQALHLLLVSPEFLRR
jgi:uncharacterized protein (DUF1800 family)